MEKAIENVLRLKYLQFKNETNICWLDASIALVAHNRTFNKIVDGSSGSVIQEIISKYKQAVEIFNNSVYENPKEKTEELLLAIQNSTQEHLKKFLKFTPGEPDSAFCALLNLIYQDKSNIKEQLSINYIWKKDCPNCGCKFTSVVKPIITLTKVITFKPVCPTSICMCTCKSKQKKELIYKELLPCLIFHFENGAGVEEATNFPLSFSIKGREYQLTTLVILEKGSEPSFNHFVTLIRNPFHNLWLECNDLNPGYATFLPEKPAFNLKDVYMCVFEAFDNLGKIINDEISVQEQDDEDVELIDLSDEDDATKNTDSSCKTTLSNNAIKNDKCSNALQDSYSEGDISKKELLVYDMKNNSDATVQKFTMHSNKKSEESVKSKNQNVFACNFKFPIKISLGEHEAKSNTFDSQNKPVDEFIEAKKCKTEVTESLMHKVAESSVKNEEENFSNLPHINEGLTAQNLGVHNIERSNEKVSNISCQNVSVNSYKFSSESPFNKHKTEKEFNNVAYQDKIDEFTEDKEFKAEKATDFLEHKVIETSVKNKEDIFSIFSTINKTSSNMQNFKVCSNERVMDYKDASDENKKDFLDPSINNKHRNKRFKESEKTRNVSTDKDEIEGSSKNFNFQNESIATSVKKFKDETSNWAWPKVTEKRERAEGKFVSSSESKTELTDDKDVNSQGKKAGMLNNEASSTSLIEKTNEENIKLSENVDKKRRVMVPSVVERTFAAFFHKIIQIRENEFKNQTSDSAT